MLLGVPMKITDFTIEGIGDTVLVEITAADDDGDSYKCDMSLDVSVAVVLGAKLLAYGTQRPTILTDAALAALMDSPGSDFQ